MRYELCRISCSMSVGRDLEQEKLKWQRGFSLMEALVVVALIGAMLAIAIPLLARMLNNYRVQTAASQFAVQLRFARNAAVKQKLKYRVIINEAIVSDPKSSTYRVEKETDYNTGVYEMVPGISGSTVVIDGVEYISLPTGVSINVASDDGPIVFNYRGGNEGSTTYDILLDTITKIRYTITVTPAGGVSTTRSEL